jgi:hypothetical protein
MRHGIQKGTAVAEAPLQLIAGAETSSTVIRSTLSFLMATPRAYNKLKEQINEAIESGAASSPITVEEAKKLPYLQVSSNNLFFFFFCNPDNSGSLFDENPYSTKLPYYTRLSSPKASACAHPRSMATTRSSPPGVIPSTACSSPRARPWGTTLSR